MVYTRSPREVDKISRSCQIVADTLIMLEPFVVPGARVFDLDKMAEDFILSQGARPAFKGYMGFPATLCVSIEDAVVHGIPGKEILTDGQIVGIDCGAELDGYYGDHAKSFAVGSINPDKQKLLTVTRESLMKGIEQAKPGNYVGDIGSAVQVHAERHGFSVVRELVGHGIGTELHEEPQIPNYGRAKQGYKLRAGMCIAIEPMINAGVKEVYTAQDGWTILTKDGKASAHFEHTIAITENGPKILSVGTHG
ncbi:MAG: type I methionyl aminopeptidase [Candidatus Marinimicrobia bacterium]|jgi:methionyl aminopeptidase|nr:type I methionyl aminopeptidase [Candidatus Neomarinimicrobiota bacterium]MBT3945779.1 type I methionyl aminopeptidase [Candidatus Neomarinimicrobiota bacterium]MBT4555245.1 type I methionyl aminopeptidase [Candidatus Neomarinimicrobiota bacterium]MBT4752674.1 type I methionyl aminopeptidase [Candidatus Neomarinimicrobiota bacterium]MBT5116132.1 type I methionyl aminopeptidase [Candidatus Neomarinimicrobiota bacterium]|tara:strand:- start:20554 stop:21309 length:756 start_codon:yes stop_codon:yes gene_type:complete